MKPNQMTKEEAAEQHAMQYLPPEEKWKEELEIEFNQRRSDFIAGVDWLKGQGALKWVKASERIPPDGMYYCRFSTNGHVVMRKEISLIDGKFDSDYYSIEQYTLEEIEWLSESSSPVPESSFIEYLQQNMNGIWVAFNESGLSKEEKMKLNITHSTLRQVINDYKKFTPIEEQRMFSLEEMISAMFEGGVIEEERDVIKRKKLRQKYFNEKFGIDINK